MRGSPGGRRRARRRPGGSALRAPAGGRPNRPTPPFGCHDQHVAAGSRSSRAATNVVDQPASDRSTSPWSSGRSGSSSASTPSSSSRSATIAPQNHWTSATCQARSEAVQSGVVGTTAVASADRTAVSSRALSAATTVTNAAVSMAGSLRADRDRAATRVGQVWEESAGKPDPVPAAGCPCGGWRPSLWGAGHPAPRCGPPGTGPDALASGGSGGATLSLLGLAPGGACLATAVTRGAGELLPHRFTLAHVSPCRRLAPVRIERRGRSVLCGAVRVSPRLGVTQHPALRSPDFPHLRRPRTPRGAVAWPAPPTVTQRNPGGRGGQLPVERSTKTNRSSARVTTVPASSVTSTPTVTRGRSPASAAAIAACDDLVAHLSRREQRAMRGRTERGRQRTDDGDEPALHQGRQPRHRRQRAGQLDRRELGDGVDPAEVVGQRRVLGQDGDAPSDGQVADLDAEVAVERQLVAGAAQRRQRRGHIGVGAVHAAGLPARSAARYPRREWSGRRDPPRSPTDLRSVGVPGPGARSRRSA